MRALPLLFLVAAATPAGFRPGRWLVSSAPATATLNGKPLGDLPYQAPIEPSYVCLTATQAADPVRWLTHDAAADCTFTKRSLAGGRVDLAGSCAPVLDGASRGTVSFTGRWTTTTYRVRFATTTASENGAMGFTGILTGRRVGVCPG